MNQIRLHGRIVKSKEGLNEGVLNSHYSLIKRTVYQTISGFMKSPKGTLAKSLPVESIRQNLFTRLLSNDPLSGCSVPAPIMMCAVY